MKINKNHVWKVVVVDPKSKKLVSTVSISDPDAKWVLEYGVGKTTTPTAGKIFAFPRRWDARQYCRSLRSKDSFYKNFKFKILKCSYTGSPIFSNRMAQFSWSIESFWGMPTRNLYVGTSPQNTIWVDSVTPIEISH